MLKANIETFLACDASYEEAGIVLYGAPFDSTTSYRPGNPVQAHGDPLGILWAGIVFAVPGP